MASCYHVDAAFHDIAFDLSGRQQIDVMCAMIANNTTIRAIFPVQRADDETGAPDIAEDYQFSEIRGQVHQEIPSMFRFGDGLIVGRRERWGVLWWGMQARGPVKGVIAWLIPAVRRLQAMATLQCFTDSDSAYRSIATG
jgi:hypothetical protein